MSISSEILGSKYFFHFADEKGSFRVTVSLPNTLNSNAHRMSAFSHKRTLEHGCGRVHSHSIRKRKVMMPMAAVITPGTMNDRPHCWFTQTPAIREPRMLPTEVWEFQMPMINPRLKKRGGKGIKMGENTLPSQAQKTDCL